MGGVIYADSADKAARFIMDCNQTGLPIIFFQDVTGFMVGRDAEQSGIIRSGAKLVNAVSNSTVPKITVVVGGSFGAGNYALCGKAYDPRFILAWPNARYAVMGAAQASDTDLQRSRPRARSRRQEIVAGRTGEIARDGESELRRANRHPLRRGARLGRRDHSAARNPRGALALAPVRFAPDAESAFPHRRGADLTNRRAIASASSSLSRAVRFSVDIGRESRWRRRVVPARAKLLRSEYFQRDRLARTGIRRVRRWRNRNGGNRHRKRPELSPAAARVLCKCTPTSHPALAQHGVGDDALESILAQPIPRYPPTKSLRSLRRRLRSRLPDPLSSLHGSPYGLPNAIEM